MRYRGFVSVFCRPFVSIVFGAEYVPNIPLIRVMLPGCLAMVIFKVLNANLAGCGHPLAALWVFLGSLGVNVLCGLTLVPIYGAMESAVGSSVSYMLGGLVYAHVYARMSDTTLKNMFFQPASDWRTLKSVLAGVRPDS